MHVRQTLAATIFTAAIGGLIVPALHRAATVRAALRISA